MPNNLDADRLERARAYMDEWLRPRSGIIEIPSPIEFATNFAASETARLTTSLEKAEAVNTVLRAGLEVAGPLLTVFHKTLQTIVSGKTATGRSGAVYGREFNVEKTDALLEEVTEALARIDEKGE